MRSFKRASRHVQESILRWRIWLWNTGPTLSVVSTSTAQRHLAHELETLPLNQKSTMVAHSFSYLCTSVTSTARLRNGPLALPQRLVLLKYRDGFARRQSASDIHLSHQMKMDGRRDQSTLRLWIFSAWPKLSLHRPENWLMSLLLLSRRFNELSKRENSTLLGV